MRQRAKRMLLLSSSWRSPVGTAFAGNEPPRSPDEVIKIIVTRGIR
jgi:hypothetical protein